MILLIVGKIDIGRKLSFNDLSPSLNNAMTFAHFQTPGNTPSVKDLLIKPVRIGAMTLETSFNKRAVSLSSPTALLDFKDLRQGVGTTVLC